MKYSICLIIIMQICLLVVNPAIAAEKTGTLVFKTLEKMQNDQEDYLEKVAGVKNLRETVQDKKKILKNQLSSLSAGTPAVKKEELAAEFAKMVALNISHLDTELDLTDDIAEKHVITISALLKKLENTGELSGKQVQSVIDHAMPVMNNSHSLFESILKYKGAIIKERPSLIHKLKGAIRVADDWQQYRSQISKSQFGRKTSRAVLVERLRGLQEQFSSIACETDILKGMLADDTVRLFIINQIKASELAMQTVAGGVEMAGEIGNKYIGDVKMNIGEIRTDIEMMEEGIGYGVSSSDDEFPKWKRNYSN